MISAVRAFMRHEASGGIVLVVAAALGLLFANSPLATYYERFLEIPGAVIVGDLEIRKPLLLWLNDLWMAVFFFLVGLEIKREFVEGELRDRRVAVLPIIGAIGGMALPAAIYLMINLSDPVGLRGWAIPAATDIAFALGVLALLGSRVPSSLKILLTAIAIIDDLGAIVVIAVFYTTDLSFLSLGLAGASIVGLLALNLTGARSFPPYLIIGAILWVCVLKSGVHATLAGVIVALAIPLRGGDTAQESPLRQIEHYLQPWVAFLVLPAFAFANAGVSFAGLGWSTLIEAVTLGIAAGLLVGKQIGVFLSLRVAVALGWARAPDGASWRQVYGLSALCGIGFTMSLFIGGLAFDDPEKSAQVRLGVLVGSVLSALIGYAVLRLGSQSTVSAPR